MQNEHLLYLIALLCVDKVGPVQAQRIIQYFGSVEQVFKASKRELMMIPKIGEKIATDLSKSHFYLSQAENILKQCQKLSIQIISYQSHEYPQILKEIYDPPLILYAKGFITKDLWGIGIVGTRTATDYGINETENLVELIVQHQIPIISGMAFGIDFYAHKKCIDLQGKTIGVLACGLDTVYPKAHENLAHEILLQGGALISEYPPGAKVNPINFPLRNRIISGLSKSVVIVESGEKGGALITAHYAFEQNREVWAIPGRVTDKKSKGCNQLIQKNIAKIYLQPSDVLEDLKVPLEKSSIIVQPALFQELTLEEQLVMQHLEEHQAIELETLCEKTDLEITILLSTLLSLEIKGLVKQLPGKKIQKNI